MKILSFVMSAVFLLGPALQTAGARTQSNKQPLTIEQVKVQVNRVGTGEKARATITTKDGVKRKAILAAWATMTL